MSSPSASEQASATMPLGREFRAGAHQALLASNGKDTFYVAEIQRAINAPGSPLERFLPPAAYTVTPRVPGSSSGGARVAYTLSPELAATARPLKSSAVATPGALALPRAEIDAFTAAVREFSLSAQSLTPLQQQCRREFRLPDPVREPDAYWVVGSGFERRLIVLWGCERFSRTSVALDRVAEHLKGCEMAWVDKQQLALQLALRPDEPLSAFLGLPAKGTGGLLVRGTQVSGKALQPFSHFSKTAWHRFDNAARAFVLQAAAPNVSPSEAELRREFRLPSLETAPSQFFRSGPNVLIDASTLDRDQTVPPVSVSDDDATDAETLTQQLSKRIKVQGLPYMIGGGIAALLAVAGGLFWVFGPDREPPQLTDVQPGGVHEIHAFFSEAISPAISLDAIFFADDKRKVRAIRPVHAEPGKVIIETVEPLIDGDQYTLVFTDKVVDLANNSLARADRDLTFFDLQPPALLPLVGISAGGQSAADLVLTFTKPLDEASIAPGAFTLGLAGEAGKRIPVQDAKLDPDTKNGTRIIITADTPFEGRRKYKIGIRNLTDRAQKRNRVNLEPMEFDYVDLLPPSIRQVTANGSTYTLEIQFSKPLDPTLALDTAHFQVERLAGDKGNHPLLAGASRLDDSGKILTLKLDRAPLASGQYRLHIRTTADRKGNKLTQPIERDFSFADAGQRGAPKIGKIEAEDTSTRLTLEFDRGLALASVSPQNFRLLASDRSRSDLEVVEATPSAEDSRRVVLRLNRAPAAGNLYYLVTERLQDVFGSTQDQPELKDFRVPGSGRSQTNIAPSLPPTWSGERQIKVAFNTAITEASSKNLANYTLVPDTLAVTSVDYTSTPTPDGQNTVTLTLSLSAKPQGEVRLGIRNLTIQGDDTNSFRLRTVPVRNGQ